MSITINAMRELNTFTYMKIGLLEIALFEFIVFLALWVMDEYIASLLCVIVPAICLGVLIISLIAEWIEPSKVPKSFFKILGISVVIPIVTLVVYLGFFGTLEWMQG